MWIKGSAAGCILMLVGCADSSVPDETHVREALVSQLQSIEEMTNQGYPPEKSNALYLDYFSANPIVLPYGGEILVGTEEVSEFYTDVFSMGTLISNAYGEPTIGISEGYVVRIYEGTAEFLPSGGDEVFTYTNVYTDILVYEDGEWKIQWHSWVPAPAN